MEETNETCDGCKHAYPVITDDDDPRMECRRYPPTMFVLRDKDGVDEVWDGFPNATDRCGEYSTLPSNALPMMHVSSVCSDIRNRNGTYSNSSTMNINNRYVTYEVESNQPINLHILREIVDAYVIRQAWLIQRDGMRARIREVGEDWKGPL